MRRAHAGSLLDGRLRERPWQRAAVELADGAAAGGQSSAIPQPEGVRRRRSAALAGILVVLNRLLQRYSPRAFDVRGTGAPGVGCGRLRCPSTRARTSEEILSFSSTAFEAGGIVARVLTGDFNSWRRARGHARRRASRSRRCSWIGRFLARLAPQFHELERHSDYHQAGAKPGIVTAQLLLPEPEMGLDVTLTASVRHTNGSGGSGSPLPVTGRPGAPLDGGSGRRENAVARAARPSSGIRQASSSGVACWLPDVTVE